MRLRWLSWRVMMIGLRVCCVGLWSSWRLFVLSLIVFFIWVLCIWLRLSLIFLLLRVLLRFCVVFCGGMFLLILRLRGIVWCLCWFVIFLWLFMRRMRIGLRFLLRCILRIFWGSGFGWIVFIVRCLWIIFRWFLILECFLGVCCCRGRWVVLWVIWV